MGPAPRRRGLTAGNYGLLGTLLVIALVLLLVKIVIGAGLVGLLIVVLLLIFLFG